MVLVIREISNYNLSCWGIFKRFFDILIYRHVMCSGVNKYFFMEVRRKADIETAFKGNLRLFPKLFTGLQIIIHCTVKII